MREYASIENSIANIATFISAKNQTPKSFLEGVIVFPNNYRPTQNGVEAIVSENPGKVYTRENLLDIAWGFDYPGDARTVDVHIRRLREKIEENPAQPDYIKTKWGVGYYYKKD